MCAVGGLIGVLAGSGDCAADGGFFLPSSGSLRFLGGAWLFGSACGDSGLLFRGLPGVQGSEPEIPLRALRYE